MVSMIPEKNTNQEHINDHIKIIVLSQVGTSASGGQQVFCSLVLLGSVGSRAAKNLRFLIKDLGFLGSNVRTVARGTLDTGIRSRRRPTKIRITNALIILCLTLRNTSIVSQRKVTHSNK